MRAGSKVIEWSALLPYRVLMRLPHRIAVPLMAHRTLTREDTVDRRSWTLDHRLRTEAYWLRFDNTSGPALSVFCDDEEFLRIDCLAGSPHLHYCVAQSLLRPGQDRIDLIETTDHDLVDRACFELEHNLGFSLHLHRRRSVQQHQLDRTRLDTVASEVGEHLRHLVGVHRSAAQEGALS